MRRVIVLCVFASLIFSLAVVAAAQERPIAIAHVRMIDGRGGSAIDDATIVLRGSSIEYAGPSRDAKVPADAQVIAGAGKTVLPGLADLHVHLQGAWDGIGVDLLGYQRYFNAMLYAGVTTVLDTGNYQPWVLQLRQEQAAGRLRGPRIYCVGAMIDATDPAWPDLAYALTSRYQIPAFVERDKQAKVDLIKAYANLSDRMLRRLVEEAAKAGLRIVVDQWDRNGSPDLVATGIAGFAHAPTRKMSNEDIQFFHDKGLFDISTLVVHESFARTRFADTGFLREPLLADTEPPWFLSETDEFAKKPQSDDDKKGTAAALTEFQESSKNVKRLWDAGVILAAGTDAPYPGVFQGESLHHELELMVRAGLTPLQAIQSATYNAAQIMKADKEWGSLQAGLRATLILVSGQPDQNISDTRKIELVIQDGKILDRQSLKFDAKRDPGFRVVPGTFVP
jgi:imidazolonepropionase-like amidohydrolase